MNVERKVILAWLPIAVTVAGCCVLIYFAVQQNYRNSANNPQIQMAEDAVDELSLSVPPGEIVGHTELFDAGKSLRPFLAIYDKEGKLLATSAYVGGAPPAPPQGVFDYAKQHGENHITWEPKSHTRIALVIMPATTLAGGGFAVAGRNMREMEREETQLNEGMSMGFILILLATLGLTILREKTKTKYDYA